MQAAYGYIRNQSISLENIPITNCNSNSCSAIIEGPEIESHIKTISINGTYIEYPSGLPINYNLESINYNSTYKPSLAFSFSR
jgi:hypothetical protein